jgi:hypothetical protein
MNREEPFGPEPLARWYWVGATASFLFMALGCFMYLKLVTTNPATLPADQQQVQALMPWWQMGGFAIGVWAGLAGTVGLFLRRTWAERALMLSLLGVVIWIGAFFAVKNLREAAPADILSIPAVVLVVTWTIYWFARHSRQRGWLGQGAAK